MALYILYQLAPLVFIVTFYILNVILVLGVLRWIVPLLPLSGTALLFALGQVFNYTISPHICNGTAGRMDGALFETLFTFLAVILVWVFWCSITEVDLSTPIDHLEDVDRRFNTSPTTSSERMETPHEVGDHLTLGLNTERGG